MKIKTKEELYSKSVDKHGYPTRDAELHNDTIDKVFQTIAERINFYKRYKNDKGHLLLMKEHPDIEEIRIWRLEPFRITIEKYNDWLFDYCFGDLK